MIQEWLALGLRSTCRCPRSSREVEARFREVSCAELRQALVPIVGDDGADSLLARGMNPYPDGWRGQVSRPEDLPHYPVVSMRGGFPDGS